MKAIVTCLLIGIFVSGTSALFAEEAKYELGTYASYFRYREPGVMEEKGALGGLFGAVTVRPQDIPMYWPEMYRFEGYFGFGQVDYTSGQSGTLDGIDEFMVEARYFAGYDFYAGTDLRVTPYVGLGYRYLRDDSAGMQSSTGAYGYKRESNYFYLPLGVEFTQSLSAGWEVGLTLEFDVLLGGQQKSHLNDVDPAYGLAKNDQEKGYGARGSIRVVRQSERFDVLFEPYVRWWEVDDSEITVACGPGACLVGYEPKNDSLEAGAKIGFSF